MGLGLERSLVLNVSKMSSLQLIQAGKGEALRIRAILRSLVPIEDLVGVISLPVQIPSFGKGKHIIKNKVNL